MLIRKVACLFCGPIMAIALLGMALSAKAEDKAADKKIRIGVVFDLSGPLAGGGSELEYLGAKIMLDYYSKVGVEGYKVEAIYADAQSRPPARAGKRRHGDGLLLFGAVRACRRPRRAA